MKTFRGLQGVHEITTIQNRHGHIWIRITNAWACSSQLHVNMWLSEVEATYKFQGIEFPKWCNLQLVMFGKVPWFPNWLTSSLHSVALCTNSNPPNLITMHKTSFNKNLVFSLSGPNERCWNWSKAEHFCMGVVESHTKRSHFRWEVLSFAGKDVYWVCSVSWTWSSNHFRLTMCVRLCFFGRCRFCVEQVDLGMQPAANRIQQIRGTSIRHASMRTITSCWEVFKLDAKTVIVDVRCWSSRKQYRWMIVVDNYMNLC